MGDRVRSRLQVMLLVAHLTAESAPCPQPLVVRLLACSDLTLVLHLIQSLANAEFVAQVGRTNRNASQND